MNRPVYMIAALIFSGGLALFTQPATTSVTQKSRVIEHLGNEPFDEQFWAWGKLTKQYPIKSDSEARERASRLSYCGYEDGQIYRHPTEFAYLFAYYRFQTAQKNSAWLVNSKNPNCRVLGFVLVKSFNVPLPSADPNGSENVRWSGTGCHDGYETFEVKTLLELLRKAQKPSDSKFYPPEPFGALP